MGNMQKVTARAWLRSAVTWRMLLLLVIFAAVAAGMIRLGAWQLDRAALRGAAEAERITAERIAADPVALEDVLAPSESVTEDTKLVKVSATGEWGSQVLVPGRQIGDADAVLVVTELRLTDGEYAGAMIPVVRGWLTPAQVDDAGGAVGVVVPEGSATVVGYLADGEKAASGSYSDGEVGAISAGQLLNLWGGLAYAGYLVQVEPDDGLGAVPPPTYADTQGMNLQNLAYAGEWFLFGGFALALWAYMVRADAQRRIEERALAQ